MLLLSSLTAPIVGNVFEVVTNIVVPTQVCFTTPGGWYDSNGQAYYTYPATQCYNIDVIVTSIQYITVGFFDAFFNWIGY